MKQNLKIIMAALFLASCFLQAEEFKKNLNTEVVLTVSKELIKNGPSFYEQCDNSEKEEIKKILNLNSSTAKEVLEKLEAKQNGKYVKLGLSLLAIGFSAYHILDGPIYPVLLFVGSVIVDFERSGIRSISKGMKGYRNILDVEKIISNCDKNNSSENKEVKN